jgi:hypothetical protein
MYLNLEKVINDEHYSPTPQFVSGIPHIRKKSKSPLQIRGHGFLFVGAFAQAEQLGKGTD